MSQPPESGDEGFSDSRISKPLGSQGMPTTWVSIHLRLKRVTSLQIVDAVALSVPPDTSRKPGWLSAAASPPSRKVRALSEVWGPAIVLKCKRYISSQDIPMLRKASDKTRSSAFLIRSSLELHGAVFAQSRCWTGRCHPTGVRLQEA